VLLTRVSVFFDSASSKHRLEAVFSETVARLAEQSAGAQDAPEGQVQRAYHEMMGLMAGFISRHR
jgi:hypothetical protein